MAIFANAKKILPKLIAISAFCYPLLFQSIDVLAQTRPPPPEPPREETRTETETRRTEPETRRQEEIRRDAQWRDGYRPTQEEQLARARAGLPPIVRPGDAYRARNENIPLSFRPFENLGNGQPAASPPIEPARTTTGASPSGTAPSFSRRELQGQLQGAQARLAAAQAEREALQAKPNRTIFENGRIRILEQQRIPAEQALIQDITSKLQSSQ